MILENEFADEAMRVKAEMASQPAIPVPYLEMKGGVAERRKISGLLKKKKNTWSRIRQIVPVSIELATLANLSFEKSLIKPRAALLKIITLILVPDLLSSGEVKVSLHGIGRLSELCKFTRSTRSPRLLVCLSRH